MGLTIEEQETHINFSRRDARAMVYTTSPTTMTKINRFLCQPDTEWKLEKVHKLNTGEVVGKTYSCPVSFISFRSKKVDKKNDAKINSRSCNLPCEADLDT